MSIISAHWPPPTKMLPRSAFSIRLREMRERRRWSQSRLADVAGYDHSYVSRIESGARVPTRVAVLALADALNATPQERDGLLFDAGFSPQDIDNLYAHEPVLGEMASLLRDAAIPTEIRDDVRNMVGLLVRQARRAVERGVA